MKHVFVETNWVVAYAAPTYHKLDSPQAAELLERAARGEIELHLPSIGIAESRRAILTRYAPRSEGKAIRTFLRWAAVHGHVSEEQRQEMLIVVSKLEDQMKKELEHLDVKLRGLRDCKGLSIFDVGEQCAKLNTELSFLDLNLKPFDQMILAAILVRSRELRLASVDSTCFCELDADLQPWDKKGESKEALTKLYDEAKIWVYGDFRLQAPARPAGWR